MISPLARGSEALVVGGLSPDQTMKVMIRATGDLPAGEIRAADKKEPLFEFDAGGYASFEAAKDKASTAALWRPDSRAVAVMTRTTKRSTDVKLFTIAGSKVTKVQMPDFFAGILKDFGVTEVWRCAFERPLRWLENGDLVLHVSGDCVINSGPQEERTKWFEYEITVSPASGKIVDSKQTLVRLKNG